MIGPLIFSNPHNVNKDFCTGQQENGAQQQHSRGFKEISGPILEYGEKSRKIWRSFSLSPENIIIFSLIAYSLEFRSTAIDVASLRFIYYFDF